MNIGSLTDRLLQFCLVLVGRFRGGLGPRQCRCQHDLRRHVRLGDRGRGRHRAHHHRDDDEGGPLSRGLCRARSPRSAAIIGPIIPPSIPMVLYALISDTSIGYLFLGRLGAGRDARGRLHGDEFVSSRGDATIPSNLRSRFAKFPKITLRAFPALMLPVILLFGIYGGVMTPTEGAAAAAFYALLASTLALPRRDVEAALRGDPHQRPGDDLDRHADRRRAGVQLRRHHREYSRLRSPSFWPDITCRPQASCSSSTSSC